MAAAVNADDLLQRVHRLEAIEAVRATLSRYAATCDSLSAGEDLGDLFTEDAVLSTVAVHEGRPAILDYYAGVFGSLSAARHHIVNSAIELEEPERARHRGYYLAILTRDGESTAVFGDYDDVLVRGADGRWRFREKGNHGAGSLPLGVSQPAAAASVTTDEAR